MNHRRKKATANNNIYILDKAKDSNNDDTMSYELAEKGANGTASVEDVAPLLPEKNGASDADDASIPPPTPEPAVDAKMQAVQLCFGAGGIYAAFLYYGSLQEDVFRYESEDGTKFTMAWYLQVLESLANVVVGIVALVVMGLTGTGFSGDDKAGSKWWGGTPNLPKKPFISTGFTQVCSKGFTSLALANGLSFPVATLAKSGKMAPVMLGSLILGGAKYGVRDYLQVMSIIAGTAILSMSKKVSTIPIIYLDLFDQPLLQYCHCTTFSSHDMNAMVNCFLMLCPNSTL